MTETSHPGKPEDKEKKNQISGFLKLDEEVRFSNSDKLVCVRRGAVLLLLVSYTSAGDQSVGTSPVHWIREMD